MLQVNIFQQWKIEFNLGMEILSMIRILQTAFNFNQTSFNF